MAVDGNRISFWILGEPASKANKRKMVKFGDRPALIKSEKARNYERMALLQIPSWARQRLEGPCKVSIRIFYASERPDLDPSVVLDCLQDRYEKLGKRRVLAQAGVVRNDRQFREMHFYHGIDKANPRAEIELEPLQAQQQAMPLLPARAERDPF